MNETNQQQTAIKDRKAAHPIASVWRPTLREVVKGLAGGDFSLAGIRGVTPLAPRTAKHIRSYLEEYGKTLTDLPEETWNSSCAQWMDLHWEIWVDLSTVEEGASDLVLFVRVFEATGDEFRFEIDSVHVP